MKMGETRSEAAREPLKATGELPPGRHRWSAATRPRSFLRRFFTLREKRKDLAGSAALGNGEGQHGWGGVLGCQKKLSGSPARPLRPLSPGHQPRFERAGPFTRPGYFNLPLAS